MAAAGGEGTLREAMKRLDGCAEAALEAQLPAGGEHHYYSNFASYSGPLGASLATIQKVLTTCEAMLRPRRAAAPDWTDVGEVGEWVSSLLDDCLEGVDTAIDEANSRAGKKGAGGGATAAAAAGGGAAALDDTLLMANLPSFGGAAVRPGRPKGPVTHAAQLARPQDLFQPPVDNSSATPFRPQVAHLQGLTAAPLDSRAYTAQPGADASYGHPFQHELDNLSYADWQLEAGPPQAPAPLEDTPLELVDTPDALSAMASELSCCTHIAIDLEAHSYRSFQGFTCLLQLSSRTKDYIVDALALRNQLGPALARLFADPSVVKVLHGADSDVDWLQRDFGLYLVNMFDTGQAMRVLAYPAASLAYLLEHTAGFQADKRYQLADWRVRPLPVDMLHYARCDTHFLLHAHDRLKQQLAGLPGDKVPPSLALPLPAGSGASGALGLVLERSRQLCLKLYRKDACSPDAFKAVVARWGLRLSPQQAGVFAALWEWRDRVCRAEDESTGYVLPKTQLVALAQDMPDSAKRLQAVLGRGTCEVVLRRISEVLSAISTGKHRPVGPEDMLPPEEAANGPAAASADAAASTRPPGPANAAAPEAAVSEAGGPSAGVLALKPRAVAPIRSRGAAAGPSSMMMMVGGGGGSSNAATPQSASAATAAVTAVVAAAAAAAAPEVMPPPPGTAPEGLQPGGAAQVASSSAPAEQQQQQAGAASSALQAARAASLGLTQVHSLNTWLRVGEASGTAAVACAVGPTRQPGAAGSAAGPSSAAATADESAGPSSTVTGKRTAGGGGGSVMAAVMGGGASKRSRLGTGGPGAMMMMGGSSSGGIATAEQQAALQQVSQLRASFALPFVSAPQGPPARPAAAAAAAPNSGAACGEAAAPSAEDPAADVARSRPTAADVRAVADQLRASGQREVHIGADGAEVTLPPSGSAQAWPAQEPGEGGEEEEVTGAGGAAPVHQVPGEDVGLDGLDFVPVPLSQMSKKDKKATRKRSDGGGGGSLRDGRGGAKHATLMRKYVTELAPGGNGGDDDDDGGNSDASGSDDDGPAHGPFAKKRRGAAPAQQQPAAAGSSQHGDAGAAVKVTPFDYSKAQEQQRRREQERKRSDDAALGADAFGGRGGRGRGRGRGRGAARGGGRASFNPFDIADEDLIKGGKRSVTMPRSGNRTFTFK